MEPADLDVVRDVFVSNWIAPAGPDLDAFESEFAARVGARHATAVTSGTAALHLALIVAGVGPGDDVLCSTLTFVASANPIRYVGANPVFIDSEAASWNLDPALLESHLAERAAAGRLPKALVLVHLYGQSADVGRIKAICDRHGVILIEDAAEALGATYQGKAPGTFGRCGIFSFNGNKIITTSGGGMLASDDLLAAIGRSQLRVLDERVAMRRRNFERYRALLDGIDGLGFMPEASYGRCTRWLICLQIDPARFGADREALRAALEAQNIESRPVWKPLHLQPLFANCEKVGGEVAETLFARGLCLPSGSSLTEADIERVASVVRSCAG
jgi:pyridoxal phosphate-dependent aminotransferase EpsN